MKDYIVIYQAKSGFYGSISIKASDPHQAAKVAIERSVTPLFVAKEWDVWKVVPEPGFSLRINGPQEHE